MASRFEKGQIVYLCSLLVMVFVILSYLSIHELNNSNEMRIADEAVEDQSTQMQAVFLADVDFFGYELNNREFYKTGGSRYLHVHDSLIGALTRGAFVSPSVDSTRRLVMQYDSAFKKIVGRIQYKGYEDFGLEGRMRGYAHELENKKLISLIDLLMLRRHEKDYLLRWNDVYVKMFDDEVRRLKAGPLTAQAEELVEAYSKSFHELVAVTDEIGLESQRNLKGELNLLTHRLNERIEEQDRRADRETLQAYHRGMNFLAVGIVLSTVLCIVLVGIIVRKM